MMNLKKTVIMNLVYCMVSMIHQKMMLMPWIGLNVLNVKSGCMKVAFHMVAVLIEMMIILLVLYASLERSN